MTLNLRGDESVGIHYPKNLDHLPDVVEEEIRLQTPLYESNIQSIRYYINENVEQIKQALEQLSK